MVELKLLVDVNDILVRGATPGGGATTEPKAPPPTRRLPTYCRPAVDQ
jgi:hypothetical protein